MQLVFFLLTICFAQSRANSLGPGEQPHLSRDGKGIIRIVYGQKDRIYCAASMDNGVSFQSPALVAEIPGMHLGMSRGPQIASSAHYSVITAMDKSGNIHWFRLDNSTGEWKDRGTVNDVQGSAPEGLMGIAADRQDNFYAVWLDIRTGKRNQVYFSTLTGDERRWSPNRLVYQSPDGHVCECCKPNVYAEGKEIAVMFRNWLDGSRDLYLLRSHDKGQTFDPAEKLGEGTWKLNGCPMDGGGVVVDASGVTHTVWQRNGMVYYCRPGEKELSVAKGRACSIAGDVISLQSGDTLQLFHVQRESATIVGTGSFLQSVPLSDHHILCVWEENKTIYFKRVWRL